MSVSARALLRATRCFARLHVLLLLHTARARQGRLGRLVGMGRSHLGSAAQSRKQWRNIPHRLTNSGQMRLAGQISLCDTRKNEISELTQVSSGMLCISIGPNLSLAALCAHLLLLMPPPLVAQRCCPNRKWTRPSCAEAPAPAHSPKSHIMRLFNCVRITA